MSVTESLRIDPQQMTKEEAMELWRKVDAQEYACDDFTRHRGDLFMINLFDQSSEYYRLSEYGFASFKAIQPGGNAFVHFLLWEKSEIFQFFSLARAIISEVMERHKLNRLTAFIPVFNEQAIRFAKLVGFVYEGTMRKAFLFKGEFYDLQAFGLVKE